MVLKQIKSNRKINKVIRQVASLALAGMLTFTSVNIDIMAAEAMNISVQDDEMTIDFSQVELAESVNGEAIIDDVDKSSSYDIGEITTDNSQAENSENTNLVTGDEETKDSMVDNIEIEAGEEDENLVLDVLENDDLISEDSNPQFNDENDDEDILFPDVVVDSGKGVLGDAVSFDENGNLIINTEGMELEAFSDEEILAYISEEMLYASGDPVKITFNMSFGQTKARAMLSYVNNLRKPENAWYRDKSEAKVWSKDLQPLTYDYDLEKVAMLRAAEVAISWGHTRPDNTSCWTAYDETGYKGSAAGENIAAGYSTPEETFVQWAEANEPYDGQGHRRNMLSKGAVSIGIGHVIFNGYDFWSQEFAYSNVNPTATKAVDGNAPVTTTIAPSQILESSIALRKTTATISEGGTCDLPDMKISITMKYSWPTAATISGLSDRIQWVVPSESSDIVSITGGEGGEPFRATVSSSAANGKEVNEIKLKAICGNITKEFILKIKCVHELENIIVPATFYADGSTVERCTRCSYSTMVPVKKVAAVTQSKSSVVWNGKDSRPAITVKDSAGKVIPKEYYTVTIKNSKGIDVDAENDGEILGCIALGAYKIIVASIKSEGEETKNKYDFAKELTFNINPKVITDKYITATLDESCAELYFVGTRVCPVLNVTDKGFITGKDESTGANLYYRLAEGKDYIVEYAANSAVGTATATIIGIGNYAGIRTLKYTIKAASFADADVTVQAKDAETIFSGSKMRDMKGADLQYSYTGAAIKPAVKITVELSDGKGVPLTYELTEGKDYTVTYKNNTASYTYVEGDELFNIKKSPCITITGKGNFKSAGTITYSFPISRGDIRDAVTNDSYLSYTGKVQKPAPVMYGEAGKALKNKTDFIVSGYCKIHDADKEKQAKDIDVDSYNIETESVLPLESGRYVIICQGIKNYDGSSIAVPFTIAQQDQKPMTKLKYVVGNVVYPEMVPAAEAVKVMDGKTVLNGFYYEPGAAEKTEKAILEGAQKALSDQSQEAEYIYYAKDYDRAGKATMCFLAIPGKGYVGSYQKTYSISGIAISKVKVNNFKASMVYDGTNKTQTFGCDEEAPEVYLKYAPKGKEPVVLKYNPTDESQSDYTVAYSYPKGANVGTVTVVITGNPQKGYTGSVKKTFKIIAKKFDLKEMVQPETEMIIDGQAPFVRIKTVEYTGAVTTPRPVICYVPGGIAGMPSDTVVEEVTGAMKLRYLEDYTLSYSNNTKRASAADKACPSVTIKGKGNYSGSIKLTYSISNEDLDGNIFVAVNGRDPGTDNPGDGSIGRPFATLQAAVNAATPGCTIYLRGGTYKGTTVIKDINSGDENITITNFPGETVNLYGVPKSDRPVIRFEDGAHNITVSGFNIGNYSSLWAYGVYMVTGKDASAKGIHDIVIENNNIFGLKTNKESEGGANAILINGRAITKEGAVRNIVIRNNSAHDNVNAYSENIAVAGNCENITIFGNKVYKNTNIGIDLYGNKKSDTYCQNPALNQPRNCVIANNVVYNCVSKYSKCAGIYVDGAHGDSYETGIRIIGNEVYNNVYGIEVGSEKWYSDYGSGPDAIGEDGVDHRVKNITIADNYIHNNSSGGIRVGGYTRAPEDAGSSSSKTGWVVNCRITGNMLVNNGSGTGGNNGEIHFSKCDNVYVSGNTFVQGLLNKKYPLYAYEWGDNNLPMEEKNWATNINIE